MNSYSTIIRSPDFDAFREWELAHGIEADRRQLSRGRAIFEAGFAAFGTALVLRYREAQRWLTEYALPKGVVEISLGRYAEPPNWCAVEIPAAFAAIQLGGRDYRAVMPGGEAYCILIPNSMVEDWGLVPEEILGRAESPRQAAAPISVAVWHRITSIVDAWMEREATPHADSLAQEAILGGCKALVDACFSNHMKRPAVPKAGLVDDARDLISSRLTTSLTVGEIAGDLAVSRRVLERAFRQYLGMTPYQYLIVERLHAARSILKRREHTVLETCAASGFQDASRFSGMYARHFGESPSETLGRRGPTA